MYLNLLWPIFVRRYSLSPPTSLLIQTPSEEAVKHGDKHTKDPKELQKETAAKAHSQKSDGKETHSEDAVHGSKHDKSPEELARETAAKAKK